MSRCPSPSRSPTATPLGAEMVPEIMSWGKIKGDRHCARAAGAAARQIAAPRPRKENEGRTVEFLMGVGAFIVWSPFAARGRWVASGRRWGGSHGKARVRALRARPPKEKTPEF